MRADFSSNLNPYGPSETMLEAIRSADLGQYVDPSLRPAREAWAERLHCHPDSLVFGCGAGELIRLVSEHLLQPGDTCAVFSPTQGAAESAARSLGAQVRTLRAAAEPGFVHDLSLAPGVVGQCRMAYLATPNNPTGTYIPPQAIVELARHCERTTLLVDQSMLSMSKHAEDLEHPAPDNVVCVRSLTLDHALGGLRLAFLRCTPELGRALEARRKGLTGASAPRLAAAIQASREDDFVRASWVCMRDDRMRLAAQLQRLGLSPLPSVSGFQLLPVPNARSFTKRLRQEHGIVVRDCTPIGLPGHVRLSARPADDRELLIAALPAALM